MSAVATQELEVSLHSHEVSETPTNVDATIVLQAGLDQLNVRSESVTDRTMCSRSSMYQVT